MTIPAAVRIIDHTFCNPGRRDFTSVAALDGPHVAGFAYGHTDIVCASLHPQPLAPAEAFEVVELAVGTAYQGRGIGKAVHDALLGRSPEPTPAAHTPRSVGSQNYVRWGWIDLGTVTSPSGRELILMRHDADKGR